MKLGEQPIWQLSTPLRQSSSSGLDGRPKRIAACERSSARLARAETSIDISLRQFLTDGYDLKTVADYEIDPAAAVSVEDAKAAIETSGRFVECITALLGGP